MVSLARHRTLILGFAASFVAIALTAPALPASAQSRSRSHATVSARHHTASAHHRHHNDGYGSNNTTSIGPIGVSGGLSAGSVNSAYSAKLYASGGYGNYSWSAQGLPPGLSLSSGIISGTPTTSGGYSFEVKVTDGVGATGVATFAIWIAPG